MTRICRVMLIVLLMALLAASVSPAAADTDHLDWGVRWFGQVGTANPDGGGNAVLVVGHPLCVVWMPASFRFDSLTVRFRPEGACLSWETATSGGAEASAGNRCLYVFHLNAPYGAFYPAFYQVRVELRKDLHVRSYQTRIWVLHPQVAH